ncbi:GW dipeptide domain-containing protein [Companilactobacillus metriopterae]|uniref:GW dipeptide domain-containing protein n=1 Tax=Companilactobacillus metriopterae TaxID=1909267 RepID=UPI00100BC99D|nr:GW dipeptide domain-containing protein [Companilactobacillus metriopterae]
MKLKYFLAVAIAAPAIFVTTSVSADSVDNDSAATQATTIDSTTNQPSTTQGNVVVSTGDGSYILGDNSSAQATNAASTSTIAETETSPTTYYVVAPEYTVWDKPYDSTAKAVASLKDYAKTKFTGFGEATGPNGNKYIHITNNDNITGWVYSGAVTSTDPAAPAAPTTTDKIINTAKKVTDVSNSVSGALDSVVKGVDSAQAVVQEPGKVITNAVKTPLDNITSINSSISGTIDSISKTNTSVTSGISGAINGVTSINNSVVSGATSVIDGGTKIINSATGLVGALTPNLSGIGSGITSGISTIGKIISGLAGLGA